MQLQPLLQRKLPLAIVNSIANISASVQWLDLSLKLTERERSGNWKDGSQKSGERERGSHINRFRVAAAEQPLSYSSNALLTSKSKRSLPFVCWKTEKYELFFEDVEVERSDATKLAPQLWLIPRSRSKICVDDVTMLISDVLPPAGDVTPRSVTQPIRKLTRRLRPVVQIWKQTKMSDSGSAVGLCNYGSWLWTNGTLN